MRDLTLLGLDLERVKILQFSTLYIEDIRNNVAEVNIKKKEKQNNTKLHKDAVTDIGNFQRVNSVQ